MPPGPPLGFPSQIVISGISPGQSGSSNGGNIVHHRGNVIASVSGDTAGVFSVIALETLALVQDPDAPPGSGRVWETQSSVDNAGPIAIGFGEALAVTVSFSCPLQPNQTTFTASVQVVDSDTATPLLQLPLTGKVNTGGLEIVALSTPPLFPGGEAVFSFRLRSSLLTEVAGVFTCDPAPGDDSPFRSDDQPQFPTIPPGAQVQFDLPVTCPSTTAAGDYNVLFGLKSIGDQNFLFSQRIPITVKGSRSVQIIPSLLPDLTLAQGDSVLCELRIIVDGGPGVISISPGPVPFGVSLDNAQQTVTVDGGVFVGIDVNVDPQAPLVTNPPLPLTFNWNLAADSLHDAESGVIAFNVRIVPPEPAELHFDIDSIVFDGPTPANGNVHVIFRRDGTFNFTGHFHDSGLVDVNYQLMAAVRDNHGTLYTMLHSGTVHGSVTPGSSDDDWNNESRNDAIAQNWVVLLEGGLEFRALASATLDFANLTIEALSTALGVAGVVLGVVALVITPKAIVQHARIG